MFLILAFLLCKLLVNKILNLNRIFFPLNGILIILKRCRLQIKKLKRSNFINKNWSNYVNIIAKCPSNMEMTNVQVHL
jgi:hypothetical protein